jgi:hypothetical protein
LAHPLARSGPVSSAERRVPAVLVLSKELRESTSDSVSVVARRDENGFTPVCAATARKQQQQQQQKYQGHTAGIILTRVKTPLTSVGSKQQLLEPPFDCRMRPHGLLRE